MTQQERSRTVRLDDRTVAYDEAGNGPGAPVLLLHGFAGGRDDFAPVLEGLGEQRRVLAVDLPGHGGSEGSDDPGAYSLAGLTRWVLRLADELDLGDFHLLGHSMGGLVAQRVAAAASQRLRSLVLADTGLGALREEAAVRIVRIALAVRDDGPAAALAVAGEGAEAGDGGGAAALERFERLEPAAAVGGARILVTAEPTGAFLRGIDIPVLVVHGEDEQHWTPGEQRLLASTVAGAQRAVIRRAGHCPHKERPSEWLAVVNAFLRRAETPYLQG